MVVTPAVLEYYQETFGQLAFEYAECWFLCCKAEDACRAERLARIRRKMTVQNGGAVLQDPGLQIERRIKRMHPGCGIKMVFMQICSSNIQKPSSGGNKRRRDKIGWCRNCSTSFCPKNISCQISSGD